MPHHHSLDQPDSLDVSPKAWSAIGHLAFGGRLVLLLAGLLSLLSVFVETDGVGALTKTVLVLATLAMVAFAVLGTVRPRRVFDLVAAAIALTLAGTWGFYAFATLGNELVDELYVLQFFAWLATLVGGLAVGSVLLPGPSAAVPYDVSGVLRRSTRGRRSGAVSSSDAPAADRSPAAGASPAADHRPDGPSAPARPATPGSPSRPDAATPAGTPATSSAATPAAPSRPDAATPADPSRRGIAAPAAPAQPEDPTRVEHAAPVPAAPSDPDAPTLVDRPAPTSAATPVSTPRAAPSPPAGDAPEAGWYPAPDGVHARWWDGRAWTDERRPLSDFDDGTPA